MSGVKLQMLGPSHFTSRKENNTSRKISPNEQKILDYLSSLKETEVNTSELADKVGIDISNISRYLKKLESERIINRRTEQQGKIRIVFISLITSRKENNTDRNEDNLTSRKEKITPEVKVKIEEKKKKTTLLDADDTGFGEGVKTLAPDDEILRLKLALLLNSELSKWKNKSNSMVLIAKDIMNEFGISEEDIHAAKRKLKNGGF